MIDEQEFLVTLYFGIIGFIIIIWYIRKLHDRLVILETKRVTKRKYKKKVSIISKTDKSIFDDFDYKKNQYEKGD